MACLAMRADEVRCELQQLGARTKLRVWQAGCVGDICRDAAAAASAVAGAAAYFSVGDGLPPLSYSL